MAAKAVGYLELNIAGFDQALKTAKNLMATFAAGFAGYKLGSVFKDGIKDAIDFGKSINSVSRSMGGLGAGNLLLVQKALERTGQGAEEAQGHIADFLKSGRSLSTLFGGSDNYAEAISKSSKEFGDQADILNRSAARLQTIWNSIEVVASKSRTFFLAMTEQFIKPLQLALDMLKSTNVAAIGERFGKAISDASLTLYGIFTNGNIVEILQLGVKLAFQEGINYLVGGFEYLAAMIPEWLIKGFDVSVEFLFKAFKILTNETLLNGMLFAAFSFYSAMFDGMNKVIKFLQAGVSYAVISAIQAIPGAGKALGIGAEKPSFGEIYNDTKNIIPDNVTNALKNAAKISGEKASDPLKNLFNTFSGGKEGFEKANIFDTGKDQARLQEIIANVFKVGTESAGKAQIDNSSAPTKGVLTSFSGASSKVIADSLAKVGGGGNFLRVGMTLSERTALDQLRAQREQVELQKVIAKNTSAEKKPVTMK